MYIPQSFINVYLFHSIHFGSEVITFVYGGVGRISLS